MSGVVIDGVQWERCNGCGEFVLIDELRYEQPTDHFPYGRDLCGDCAPPDLPLGQTVTLVMPKDYMGDCHCGQPATTKEWCAFERPLAITEAERLLGCEPSTGVWHFVCDTHREEKT